MSNGTILLTPAMVQEETQLGRAATYALVKELRTIRHGRRILVPRSEIERWVQESAR